MVLLETHGDYTDSPTVVELMKGASMDTVGLVWDAHHTFAAGKEQPSASWGSPEALGAAYAPQGFGARGD